VDRFYLSGNSAYVLFNIKIVSIKAFLSWRPRPLGGAQTIIAAVNISVPSPSGLGRRRRGNRVDPLLLLLMSD
jgi:hypothetical protein